MAPAYKESAFYPIFLSELREMFWVEEKISSVLRRFQDAVKSPDFARILRQGRTHAFEHTNRVRGLFESLEEPAEGAKSAAIERWAQDMEQVVADQAANENTADLTIMIAAQKAGRYKIACYENLITLSQILAAESVEKVLEGNIIDDAGTDLLLRELSERYIHKEAVLRKGSLPSLAE
ncbi:YciE/YciF ferroxidase family protein [Dyadobacter aurulentus]|uniref:YciE/YciF ferroxidase family protein n=1 Tax=Dyadobacter sp. UC 10 TaxID=2605428 RepID=UPI001788AC8C|nr:DUF892 family protein [Dyadobacter sp. UC 10]